MNIALLIDEDQVVRLSLAQWLREAGWDVYEADEGDAGLALALEKKPSLILCDLLAPRHNGFQICRRLRNHPTALPQAKIIVTTSSSYGVDRSSALEAGADEYIVKPISKPDFFRILRRLHEGEFATEILRADDNEDGAAGRIPPSLPTLLPSSPAVVRFWGVRGSIATPGPATLKYGGNTSCIEVRADGQLIILDAGTGIRALGDKLAEEFKDKPLSITLLISHTHWDHIQGFPFFGPAYDPKNKLRILGYEGAREGLSAALSSQMESPYFPVGWGQLPGHIAIEELQDPDFHIGTVEVKTICLNHPGVCIGYRLNTSQGSIAYLPDNEPFQRYKFQAGQLAEAGSTDVLAFARRMDQKLVEFVRDVDVLILDAQYDATEYQTRAGWGHGCVDDVVALALNANAKRLFLFHHDPGHDDQKIAEMTAWGRQFVAALGESLKVEAAQEGLEVVLNSAVKATR